MKRIISLLLASALALASVGTVFSEEIRAEDTAQIVFSKNMSYDSNIKKVTVTGGYTPFEIGGRVALKRGYASENTRHIQIDVADEFFHMPDGGYMEVEVEYYDVGKGKFSIAYDGTNNMFPGKGYQCTEAETVQMTDSKTWKTYTFCVPDMCAMGRYSGFDLHLRLRTDRMGTSAGDIYIGSVKLKKAFPKEPIYITGKSEFVGNIYGNSDDKSFVINLKNLAGYGFDSEVSYSVTDANTSLILEGKKKIESETDLAEVAIDLNSIQKFGKYLLCAKVKSHMDVDGERKEYNNEYKMEFSVINKSAHDERNRAQYASTHATWYNGSDGSETIALAAYAGLGGIRDGAEWNNIETVQGKYQVPKSDEGVIMMAKENNLTYLYGAAYGNQYYDNKTPVNTRIAPKSDSGIEAYAKYCAYMAETYKGKFDVIEIWNEYNLRSFNAELLDGAAYVKMLKAAYTAIKAVNPDIIVCGIASAGVDLDFTRVVLEAGGFEYMDAVSCHPYDWSQRDFKPQKLKDEVGALKALLREYGGEKPIFFTEFGRSTEEPKSPYTVTKEEQANSFVKFYAAGRGEKLFERNYWYDLIDDGFNESNREHGFGLVESWREMWVGGYPFSAKPGYIAMAGVNKLLADAEPLGGFDTDGLWAYRFRSKNGDDIAIVWTEEGKERTAGLRLGCDEVEILDVYTNSMGRLSAEDGVFNIAAGKEPVYLRGDFSSFETAKSSISVSELSLKVIEGDELILDVEDSKKRKLVVKSENAPDITVSESYPTKEGCRAVYTAGKGITGEKRKLPVNVYDGEKLILSTFIHIEFADPITVYATTSKVSPNDSTHWQAEVHIENISTGQSYSGNCRIVAKDGEKLIKAPVFFTNLHPKEEVTLYINLDPMIKKRNHELTIRVELDNGFSTQINQSVDFTSAMYAVKKPTIDGKTESGEWLGDWLCADSKKQASTLSGWKGVSDLSYLSNIMWDTENFYMAVIVEDDIHHQKEKPDEMWRADCVQFAIEDKINSGKHVIDPYGASTDFTEIGIGMTNAGEAMVYRYSCQGNKKKIAVIENCETKITRNKTKTIYETAIPWTELFADEYVLDEKTVFGFSMLVNDNDGSGRRGWVEYNEGIGRSKNAILFGRMRLNR